MKSFKAWFPIKSLHVVPLRLKKNTKICEYHCYLLFAINFHLSDIFFDIPCQLNFADGIFCSISRGLYFAKKAELRKNREI